MRKKYSNPSMSVSCEVVQNPLCSSTVTGNNGIGYGGTDKEGEKDPDVKALEEEEDFMNMLIEQEFVDKHSLW